MYIFHNQRKNVKKPFSSDAYNSVDGKHFERKEKQYATRNDALKKFVKETDRFFRKIPYNNRKEWKKYVLMNVIYLFV